MRQPDRRTYDDLYNENQRLVRQARESTLLFRQVREDAAHIKQIIEGAFAARRHLLRGFHGLNDLHTRVTTRAATGAGSAGTPGRATPR